MASAFHLFRVGGDWAYLDFLQGEEIQPGTKVKIKFPDGTEVALTLQVDKGTMKYGDMGHTYSGPDHKAYFEHDIHGYKARIYVRGTKLLAHRLQ